MTEHFSLEEFLRSDTATRLKIANTPTAAHLKNLQVLALGMEAIRTLLGNRPVIITSGYRNPMVNKAVGGVATSAHALGYAADFSVRGLTPLQAGRIIRDSKLKFDQLIHEVSRNILHVSFDPRLRRQVLTQEKGPGTPFKIGLA